MLDPAISIRYMTIGYLVILIILGIYLASLFIRWKNLKRELEALNEIENK